MVSVGTLVLRVGDERESARDTTLAKSAIGATRILPISGPRWAFTRHLLDAQVRLGSLCSTRRRRPIRRSARLAECETCERPQPSSIPSARPACHNVRSDQWSRPRPDLGRTNRPEPVRRARSGFHAISVQPAAPQGDGVADDLDRVSPTLGLARAWMGRARWSPLGRRGGRRMAAATGRQIDDRTCRSPGKCRRWSRPRPNTKVQ
jgi:hypothetical protein